MAITGYSRQIPAQGVAPGYVRIDPLMMRSANIHPTDESSTRHRLGSQHQPVVSPILVSDEIERMKLPACHTRDVGI